MSSVLRQVTRFKPPTGEFIFCTDDGGKKKYMIKATHSSLKTSLDSAVVYGISDTHAMEEFLFMCEGAYGYHREDITIESCTQIV